jgi:hypothetical protein
MVAKIYSTLLFFLFISGITFSQKLQLSKIGLGYQLTETEAVANNPYTITGVVKNPIAYQNFLTSFQATGFSGGGGIQNLQWFTMQAGFNFLTANKKQSKYALLMGLGISNRLIKPMSLVKDSLLYDITNNDTIAQIKRHYLNQSQQFFAFNVGLQKSFKLNKNLYFTAGINGIFSIATTHYYTQQQNIFQYSFKQQREIKNETTSIADTWKGKNFFQFQLQAPFGIEYSLLKNRITLKPQLILGIVNRGSLSFSNVTEAHGFSFSTLYNVK